MNTTVLSYSTYTYIITRIFYPIIFYLNTTVKYNLKNIKSCQFLKLVTVLNRMRYRFSLLLRKYYKATIRYTTVVFYSTNTYIHKYIHIAVIRSNGLFFLGGVQIVSTSHLHIWKKLITNWFSYSYFYLRRTDS